jgi:transposase InsO family protein
MTGATLPAPLSCWKELHFTGQGLPETIKVDNGSEFISKALDSWAHRHGVRLEFSRPGKPTHNAFIGKLQW